MNSFTTFLENGVTNLLPIDKILEFADERQEFIMETDDYIVVRPKSHQTSCYYGQYTRSKYCLADEEDSSEWDQIDMITDMLGDPAYFYYVMSKKLSTKNKNAIFGVMVYPKAWGDMRVHMSDEQLIQAGKERARQVLGTDIHYDDEFLLRWVAELRQTPAMFESYNSNNTVVLPSELKEKVGDRIYNAIIK